MERISIVSNSLFRVLTVMVCLLFPCVTPQSRVVRTPLGDIRGRVASYQEGQVHQFLGIRYAKAPTGNQRFKKPVAVAGWTDELYAAEYGPSCPQSFPYNSLARLPNRNISEDCLVLNIYKPILGSGDESKAIMVYIHGGGFNSGQGMATDGSLLALKGDVIVVTINYRLDIFGFLYTGDDAARGNYGLWDQLKAMEWIQSNINAFGGDPKRVTVFGVSAGAFSVGLHLFSAHSRGLFQRAILQSGTPFTKLSLAFDPIQMAKNVSLQLRCTDDEEWDTEQFLNCMKSKTVEEIISASVAARTHQRIAYRLDIAPVIDGDFIKEHPRDLVVKGDMTLPFYSTDIITGTDTAEGGNVLYILNSFNQQLDIDARVGVPRTVMCNNVTHYLVEDFYQGNKDVSEQICEAYNDKNISENDESMKVVDLVGDMMFVAPAIKFLDYHAKYATTKATYQYVFSHEPNFNNMKYFFPWFKGTNHLDDVPFVFGPKLTYSSTTVLVPEEEDLSNKIMKYWSTFAKTGNPNGVEGITKWPEFTTTDRQYINLSLTLNIGHNLWADRMQFWNTRLPLYLDQVNQVDFTQPENSSLNNDFNVLLTFILYTLTAQLIK